MERDSPWRGMSLDSSPKSVPAAGHGQVINVSGLSSHICMAKDINGALGLHVLPALKLFRVALAFLPILSLLLSA